MKSTKPVQSVPNPNPSQPAKPAKPAKPNQLVQPMSVGLEPVKSPENSSPRAKRIKPQKHETKVYVPSPGDDAYLSLAKEVLFTADRISNNGKLSCSELTAFLHGTPHQPFMEWLCQMQNFRSFDTDETGDLGLGELVLAIKQFMNENKVRCQSW